MARRSGFDGDLVANLDNLPERVDSAVYALTEMYAPRVEEYAKQNAPWTDQTSNARNTLNARAEHSSGFSIGESGGSSTSQHSIIIAHGMPYGIWLEVRNNGQFGIILDTIRTMGLEIMANANMIMSRLRGGL